MRVTMTTTATTTTTMMMMRSDGVQKYKQIRAVCEILWRISTATILPSPWDNCSKTSVDYPSNPPPTQCCKEHGKEMPGQILQVPFVRISVKDRIQDLLGGGSCCSFVRIFVQVSIRDLHARFLWEIFQLSMQAPYTRSPGKISKRHLGEICARDLQPRFPYKISKRGLLARSLQKRSRLYKRSLGKIYVETS